MAVSTFLMIAIFFISLVLTMVGLGGGLVFSPLFVILGDLRGIKSIHFTMKGTKNTKEAVEKWWV